MHDTRHEVSLGASHVFDLLTLAGGYSFSRENDYLSHTIGGSLSRELNDKNSTLALGYGISLNTVGRSGDDNFARDMTQQHASLTWTQLVNPRLVTQVVYELTYANGYQASPYRFVPVRMDAKCAPQFWVPETDPNTRTRHALVLGANHAVGEASSLQGDYRFYLDDWGISAHTFGARYFVHLTKNLELRLRERFYIQTGASFYQKGLHAGDDVHGIRPRAVGAVVEHRRREDHVRVHRPAVGRAQGRRLLLLLSRLRSAARSRWRERWSRARSDVLTAPCGRSCGFVRGGLRQSSSIDCSDGLICPDGTRCAPVPSHSLEVCAQQPDLDACTGMTDGIACETSGSCIDGVCLHQLRRRHSHGAEECDGADLAANANCTELGYYDSAPLVCSPACTYDVVATTPRAARASAATGQSTPRSWRGLARMDGLAYVPGLRLDAGNIGMRAMWTVIRGLQGDRVQAGSAGCRVAYMEGPQNDVLARRWRSQPALRRDGVDSFRLPEQARRSDLGSRRPANHGARAESGPPAIAGGARRPEASPSGTARVGGRPGSGSGMPVRDLGHGQRRRLGGRERRRVSSSVGRSSMRSAGPAEAISIPAVPPLRAVWGSATNDFWQ